MVNAEQDSHANDFAGNEAAAREPIQITADVCESVNFAMQQNHVPIMYQVPRTLGRKLKPF